MPRPSSSEPISRMIDRGVRVRWHCDVSVNHYGDADLKRVAKAKGGDYSLANKRPPCRIPGCPGIVVFKDCSSQYPVPPETITDRDDAWWVFSEKRRVQLKALGYRVQDGKWVAPDTTKPAPAKRSGAARHSKQLMRNQLFGLVFSCEQLSNFSRP